MSTTPAVDPEYPAKFFAKLFDLSERRIQQLAKEKIIPRTGKGQYPFFGTVNAYVKYLRDRAEGVNEISSTTLDKERTRLTRAKADMEELDLAQKRKEVAPLDMIIDLVGDAFALLKTQIRNLDRRTVGQLLGESNPTVFKEKLLGEVDLVLNELPKDLETMFKDYLDEL